jgi:D-alanyl-D-alanine carboxypeptidase-like protein
MRPVVVVCLLALAVLTSGCGPALHDPRAAEHRPRSGHRAAGGRPARQHPNGPGVDETDGGVARAPCYGRTRDLGLHRGYLHGAAIRLRLCSVPGFPSSGLESRAGSPYYVAGSGGDVIVGSQVSASVAGLLDAARHRGLRLVAVSSFRTRRHQVDLCSADRLCREGDYKLVARPGYSSHQSGSAIDFAGPTTRGGRSCAHGRAVDPRSRVWRFLSHNARHFGFEQYAAESWHWDASGDPDRC